jgi:hypothetical protein
VHTITVDPGSRILLSTQLVVTDEPWEAPRLRLHIRTDSDAGVVLDFRDPDGLQLLASATRALVANYRATQRRPRHVARPTARALAF